MSTTKHTAEPWHTGRHAPDVVVDINDHFIATTCPGTSLDVAKEDATAARIAACVNACAGIEDPKAFIEAAKALSRVLDTGDLESHQRHALDDLRAAALGT